MLDKQDEDQLAAIRHWENLKVAGDEQEIWVKDIDQPQINTLEIRSIPFKKLFYAKEGKLYLLNSQLPDRVISTHLWTPINRALKVTLPSFNHNYFGIEEKIKVSIIQCEQEQPAQAIITTLDALGQYIESAPSIRYERIKWTILNNDKAILVGTPLLPISGKAFWQKENSLIPLGYDFELQTIYKSINMLLDNDNTDIVVWDTDNTYSLISKLDLQPLTIDTYRRSVQLLSLS